MTERYEPTVKETIIRLRRQLVVHSILYYRLDYSIWTDSQFDGCGRRLAEMQKEHGWQFGYMDDVFKDWTGGTGYHLCGHGTNGEFDVAMRLKRLHEDGVVGK